MTLPFNSPCLPMLASILGSNHCCPILFSTFQHFSSSVTAKLPPFVVAKSLASRIVPLFSAGHRPPLAATSIPEKENQDSRNNQFMQPNSLLAAHLQVRVGKLRAISAISQPPCNWGGSAPPNPWLLPSFLVTVVRSFCNFFSLI